MKKLAIAVSIIILSVCFLSGCIHDTEIKTLDFYDGEVVATIGSPGHIAKRDFININFYKNCSYIIDFSYNVGGEFGNGERINERFQIDVPFVPYSHMIERNRMIDLDIKITRID